jgi:hypothetical protein
VVLDSPWDPYDRVNEFQKEDKENRKQKKHGELSERERERVGSVIRDKRALKMSNSKILHCFAGPAKSIIFY